MRFARLSGLLPAILLAGAAYADVTVRWSTRFDFTEGLPAAFTQAAQAQASMKPGVVVWRASGDRSSVEQGPLRVITDTAKSTVTIVHADSKSVATGPLSAYPPKIDPLAKLPPEARERARQALEGIKLNVETSKPAGVETIRGIQAEPYQVRLTMTMPSPKGPIEMRMKVDNWIPLASEVERNPELKACAALIAKSKDTMNPAVMMEKAFSSMPGAAEKFRTAFAELMKNAVNISLRMRMTIAMPSLLAMADTLKQAGMTLPPNFDGTLGAYSMELSDLDSKPAPASAFAVPADYRSVSMEELFQNLGTPPQAR
jgi:hypothetical protein